nr:MAG TPA: hypothetical protein [Caudoviricetes sp.]
MEVLKFLEQIPLPILVVALVILVAITVVMAYQYDGSIKISGTDPVADSGGGTCDPGCDHSSDGISVCKDARHGRHPGGCIPVDPESRNSSGL